MPCLPRSNGLVKIEIALPYYRKAKLKTVKCVGPLAVSWEGRRELVFVFAARLGNTKVPLLLFRHPILDEYKADKQIDCPTRFAFFCQTVATYITVEGIRGEHYDLIHCNDWHTALLPLLLGESPKVFFRNGHVFTPFLPKETLSSRAVRSILTIHNPVYHGNVGAGIVGKIALDRRQFHVLGDRATPYVNLLREGLEYADVITTVSPTFAREMLTQSYGPHVTAILKKRKDHLLGILNGVDSDLWDPNRYSIIKIIVSKTYKGKDSTQKGNLKNHITCRIRMYRFWLRRRLDKYQKDWTFSSLLSRNCLRRGIYTLSCLVPALPPW